MSTFLEASASVIEVLRASGFNQEADELTELVKSYTVKRDKAVKQQISEMCHIKWLGDLNITSMPSEQWLGLLENLRRRAN